MKFVLVIFCFILFSCSNQNSEKKSNSAVDEIKNKNKLTTKVYNNVDDKIKDEVISTLSIPKSEKFKLEIFYENLNNDEVEDAIVLVNRLDYAKEQASKSNNPAKIAELGYLGSYNYFFFYDGNSKKMSIPIVLGSSAKTPLKVHFENIQSEFYKDIIIEYRIRNAAFRNFYLLRGATLQLAFQWKIFDLLGTSDYEASYIGFAEGTFSLAKDILIYKGKISNHSTKIDDVYAFEPTIENTKELYYRFFFDPKRLKYVTKDKPKNELP